LGTKLHVKCHNCGEENIVDVESIEINTICEITFVCSICGALNNILFDPNNPDPENQEWISKQPQGFQWVLPSGKIEPIIGDPIYVSAFGEHLSRKVYFEKYKVDPEIAYQYMRRKRDSQIAGKITNNLSQSVAVKPMLDLSKIQKIEVLCKNCNSVCEFNL
jgi:hypothetical protein